MDEKAISEREEQLRAFIALKVAASHKKFSDEQYTLSAHAAVLREVEELLKVWDRVKAQLKGDK